MSLCYLSLCSGIEAPSVAWTDIDWSPVAFSEIEPFACAVLAHHYPSVPNLGDMTKIDGRLYRGAVDLIVGGTPCQDFSVAGKRAGLAGERSGLAMHFARLVDAIQPRWILWENVPGVFSTNEGRDFGKFTTTLEECGYGLAWRTLDAQYFGVPQRRRRVFLVGYLGDWRPAAAVLFEPHCLRRDTAPRGEKRAEVAGTLESSLGRSRGAGTSPTAIITQTLTGRLGAGGADDNKAQGGFYIPAIVTQSMSCKWSKGTSGPSGDEHHNIIAFHGSQDPYVSGQVTHPLGQNHGQETCIAFTERGRAKGRTLEYQENQAYCLANPGSGGRTHSRQVLDQATRVRRLTPRECERLQGFPDDYTAIMYRGKQAADSPRYKALGNSMAVPVIRWIGERINIIQHGLPK